MHPNEIALNEYIDDALAAGDRADVERHLATCAECRALVDDLRDIRRAAAALEPRDVPVRAWRRIERAIQLEQEHRGGGRAKGLRYARWQYLAAAAVVLIATVVGIQLLRPARTTAPPPSTAAAAPTSEAAIAIEAELRAAEQHYEKAISGLEQIAKSEQGALDPRTAATLQKNLAVIDQAISESRAALRTQPASEPAQQSLIENFKTKIALLQDTVALINEMRKGNEAGAARIVSGLKQKGD
jgi:anti-sigma factor RsiW